MKAVDFIKKFGWEYAKDQIEFFDQNKHIATTTAFMFRDDLKRLVEAWELVKSYGGLKSCYEKLYMLHELTENPEPIRQAITLVEEVENENQD